MSPNSINLAKRPLWPCRAWLCVAVLVCGHSLVGAPLTTLKYKISGTALRVTPGTLAVPKGIPGSILIELVSGGMLIVIGVLFVTDRFAYLNSMAGGLASVSYNLEACSTGVLRGEFPAGDWGTCMKLGPNYQELMPKSQAEPSVLAVLADGRMLVIGG